MAEEEGCIAPFIISDAGRVQVISGMEIVWLKGKKKATLRLIFILAHLQTVSLSMERYWS